MDSCAIFCVNTANKGFLLLVLACHLHAQTSLVHLVCLEAGAQAVPCSSLCPFSLPGAGEKGQRQVCSLETQEHSMQECQMLLVAAVQHKQDSETLPYTPVSGFF